MNRSMLALLIAAVGCGSGTARRQPSHLELVMPAAPIEVAGGRTREIQILVMACGGYACLYCHCSQTIRANSGTIPASVSVPKRWHNNRAVRPSG